MRRLLLLLLISISYTTSGQWKTLHPKTPLHHYLSHAFVFKNNPVCLAVGNVIGLSSDGGRTWLARPGSRLPVGVTTITQYFDIFFTSETKGFFLFQNEIYKTTDGGFNWEKKFSLEQRHPQYKASAYFQSLFFLNDDHGFAVGEFEKLFETTDGGETWNAIRWSNETSPYRSFSDVVFLNDLVGFVSGYEVSNISMNFGFREFVMKTIDGGENWIETEVPTQLENRALHLQFINDMTGFVRVARSQYGDDIFATTDGGSSWSSISLDSLQYIRASHWVDQQTGFMFGRDWRNNTRMFRTEDRGGHWAPILLPIFSGQDEAVIQSFAFTDDMNGYAVGSGGNILHTSDKGKTWQTTNTGYPRFNTIDFISEKKGYASSGRGFFTTTDGGNSWLFAERSDSLIILNMKFDAEGDGTFYGFRNNYYHIQGQKKKIEPIELPVTFLSISEVAIDGDSLFACGKTIAPNDNVFLRSSDHGVHWEKYSLPMQDFIIDLNRVGTRFFAGTPNSIITSHNGKNWRTLKEFPGELVETVMFLNDSEALAVVSHDVMYSGDGGLNWELVIDLDASAGVSKFLKVSDRIVFAHGYKVVDNYRQGAIWKSSNGGRSWIEEVLPVHVSEGINDMSVRGNYVFASGGFGQILRYTIAELVTSSESEPDDYLQVYPVPAQEYLTLQLQTTETILNINFIDLAGKEWPVSYTQEGQTCRINTADLPSALYIVSVVTNHHIYRKRIVRR